MREIIREAVTPDRYKGNPVTVIDISHRHYGAYAPTHSCHLTGAPKGCSYPTL